MAALVCSPARPALTSQITIYGWSTRWLVFCGWFVGGWLSWQTPGALSPDLEDLL